MLCAGQASTDLALRARSLPGKAWISAALWECLSWWSSSQSLIVHVPRPRKAQEAFPQHLCEGILLPAPLFLYI